MISALCALCGYFFTAKCAEKCTQRFAKMQRFYIFFLFFLALSETFKTTSTNQRRICAHLVHPIATAGELPRPSGRQ